MLYQAHKGVNSQCPENTMLAFRTAIEQGYDYIELDPGVTADGQFVVLHDKTINRTGRNADGSKIDTEILISDITYEQAMQYEFGSYFDPKFIGEKLPLMKEVLSLCAEHHVKLKIDNKIERFTPEQLEDFYSLIESSDAVCGITSKSVDFIIETCKRLPHCDIHYDGIVTEDILKTLKSVTGGILTVWMPMKCKLTHWVKIDFVNKDACDLIKKYALLGLWIIDNELDFEKAKKFGADIIETPGQIKPPLSGVYTANS